jgi:hypothetical protein
LSAWALPSAGLVFMPKCPACLAAYMMLWTGLGLSLAVAAYLRWILLAVCIASLLFVTLTRLRVMVSYFNKETKTCNIKQ